MQQTKEGLKQHGQHASRCVEASMCVFGGGGDKSAMGVFMCLGVPS